MPFFRFIMRLLDGIADDNTIKACFVMCQETFSQCDDKRKSFWFVLTLIWICTNVLYMMVFRVKFNLTIATNYNWSKEASMPDFACTRYDFMSKWDNWSWLFWEINLKYSNFPKIMYKQVLHTCWIIKELRTYPTQMKTKFRFI